MSERPKCGDEVTIHGTVANCDNDGAMVLFRGIWPHAVKVPPEGFHALLPDAAPQEGMEKRIAETLAKHSVAPLNKAQCTGCSWKPEGVNVHSHFHQHRQHQSAEIAKAIGGLGDRRFSAGLRFVKALRKFHLNKSMDKSEDKRMKDSHACCMGTCDTIIGHLESLPAAAPVQELGDEERKELLEAIQTIQDFHEGVETHGKSVEDAQVTIWEHSAALLKLIGDSHER